MPTSSHKHEIKPIGSGKTAPARGVERTAALRVILVGRTGLDKALRRDRSVELIRARTPLDALGELADPIDETSPHRTVVVVAPDAEPAPRTNQNTTPTTPTTPTALQRSESAGTLGDFLAGLKRIDPDAQLFRVARNGDALPKGYDGSINPEHALEILHQLIEPKKDTTGSADFLRETEALDASVQEIRSQPASISADKTIESKPIPVLKPKPVTTVSHAEAPGHTVCAGHKHAEEIVLLEQVIARKPILEPAMVLLRHRLGCEDVVFVPADTRNEASSWTSWTSAAVRGLSESSASESANESSANFGMLRSPTVSVEALESHAQWLGAWLCLEQSQQELAQAAFHDPLTGACNRRFFDSFLPRAIDQAREQRQSLTVLVFDIDDFKHFNDEFGHAAGDEILTECVRLLRAAVRPTDKICRIGGDEFAVIFHEPQGPRKPDSHHPTDVHAIAERFRSMVRTARFRKLGDDAPGHLTISGGLATFPWDGITPEELVERADQLAFEGKRQGKNVIAIGPGHSPHAQPGAPIDPAARL